MASRIWINIPQGHQFNLKLTIISGTQQIVADAIYDPVGPDVDPPWNLNELVTGITRTIDDHATATFDARYVKSDPTVIEITASVNEIASGTPYADTEGDNEYRQRFQGSGPGGRTELPFYLYVA